MIFINFSLLVNFSILINWFILINFSLFVDFSILVISIDSALEAEESYVLSCNNKQ